MQTRSTRAVVMIASLAILASACGSDKKAATTTTAATATTAAAGATTAPAASGGGKVGFILPDSKSSARWEGFDRPLITAACAKAGLTCDIQNAEGDATKMATIADQMITEGVKVLAIVDLDSASGAAIQNKAKAAGVKNIDYDRLTLGGAADVYVSFDNVAVGTAQGEGIVKCLGGAAAKGKNVIELDGSPDDNNATLFKQGYLAAIKDSGINIVGDQAVPKWDNQVGGQLFEQMLTAAGGKVDGVLAANDGLSLAAQAVLTKNGLKVPATGQDATVDGLRAILQGTQCMTVYKPVIAEAQGAVDAAVALIAGKKPDTTVTINNKTGDIPYIQAKIQPIYIDSVKVPVADGFVKRADVCKDIEDLCKANGV